MATLEFWIQLENRAWDVAPNNVDRISGHSIQQIINKAPVVRVLTSPETGVVRNRTMYLPLDEDALILRRYTANWAGPDDRKVNPWDINEHDPTDNGTMGTIPGPVIECNVGDTVVVHFRNKDFRFGKDIKSRTHSLHPHGFVFDNRYDGAYPLSPPDPTQPVGVEASPWASVGVTDFKKGDRVPPSATFTYTWNTFGWATTSGVWHYHDHSICDAENIKLGVIGLIVVHNPADPDDVLAQDLPGGSPNGSPIATRCFPLPFPVTTLPHDANRFLSVHRAVMVGVLGGTAHDPSAPAEVTEANPVSGRTPTRARRHAVEERIETTEPEPKALTIDRGDITFELAADLLSIARICIRFYRTPPSQALYLQLYHEMPGVGMLINGRKYLGNSPTIVAGLTTKMRFGLVGMNDATFHTFHLHGHRWIIPGPRGTDPNTIQNSAQVQAVSQFEDTKIFGPANSFSFKIDQGSFMGARFPPDPGKASGLGEWHMHCHVLSHMMEGMMGSLLVIQGGELALGLPRGEPCPEHMVQPNAVDIQDNFYDPASITILAGQKVRWVNRGGPHTVSSNKNSGQTFLCGNVSSEIFDSGLLNSGDVFEHTFTLTGIFHYHCEVHGCSMSGMVTVT